MFPLETKGQVIENEPLAKYTTWRVGGKARWLYKPADVADLQQTLRQVPSDVPVVWLGLGSNTLVRDGGINGFVILTQGALKNIALQEERVVSVDVGVSCASMARFCARHHLARAEFWAGIPGTMGGALRMNAGCFNGETWDSLTDVTTIDRQGNIKNRSRDEFQVAYREVKGLNENEWFISARFALPSGDKIAALQTIKELLQKRADTQPTGDYTCGSVFRNPQGDHAARLIEQCGLKGRQLGGASISMKHANFITNGGDAKASQIEALIKDVRQIVEAKTGVDLVREVHIIGEEVS